jgi:hypothetical protein
MSVENHRGAACNSLKSHRSPGPQTFPQDRPQFLKPDWINRQAVIDKIPKSKSAPCLIAKTLVAFKLQSLCRVRVFCNARKRSCKKSSRAVIQNLHRTLTVGNCEFHYRHAKQR